MVGIAPTKGRTGGDGDQVSTSVTCRRARWNDHDETTDEATRANVIPADIRTELKAQLTSRVRWTETVQYLSAQGVSKVVEVGSGDVLRGLVKRIDRGMERAGFVLNEGNS